MTRRQLRDAVASIGCGALVAASLLLAGCTARPALRAQDAWIRAAEGPHATAAYFEVVNGGPDSVVVTAISGDFAESFPMHETVRDGAMMSMREVGSMRVPPHGVLKLEPGAGHVMVMQLRRNLVAGERVRMTLHLRDGRELPVVATVRQ